ncbi:MAG: hypothetical protein DRI84_06305 [Bacteroidetes bacterium]|nr:MAG: hypothetical protein DRI84_06305 [Bacteroidota bacterium]
MLKKLILFFALYLLNSNYSNAQWISGGTLGFEYISGNSYKITYKEHNDCGSINSGSTRVLNAHCIDNSSFDFSFAIPRKNSNLILISPRCINNVPYCYSPEIKESIYDIVISLPPVGDWEIYTNSNKNRVPATTDSLIVNYEVMITFLARKYQQGINTNRNSPVFNSDPFVILNVNQEFNYNIAAMDKDGDSLVYSLVAAYSVPGGSWNSRILYKNPYSGQSFVSSSTPITLDSVTGALHFTPDNTMTAALGIRVEEWRTINDSAFLMGVTRQDFRFQVRNDSNTIPKLSGMNFGMGSNYNSQDTIYEAIVNPNDTLRFTINAFDADLGEAGEMRIIQNSALSGDSFIVYNNFSDSAYAVFEWVPTVNDISYTPKYFTVLISDSACPYNGQQIYTYSIYVMPRLDKPSLGNDTTLCSNYFQSLVLDAGPNHKSYLWQDSSSQQTYTVNSYDYILNLGSYDYWVRVSDSMGQVKADTIEVAMTICGGFEEKSSYFEVSVIPNPSRGKYIVSFNVLNRGGYTLVVYDIYGNKLLRKEVSNMNGNGDVEIDLSPFMNGVYFLNCSFKDKTIVKKLIKQ